MSLLARKCHRLNSMSKRHGISIPDLQICGRKIVRNICCKLKLAIYTRLLPFAGCISEHLVYVVHYMHRKRRLVLLHPRRRISKNTPVDIFRLPAYSSCIPSAARLSEWSKAATYSHFIRTRRFTMAWCTYLFQSQAPSLKLTLGSMSLHSDSLSGYHPHPSAQ